MTVGVDCWELCIIIYSINYALVFKNRLDMWAARGQPTAGFRDC